MWLIDNVQSTIKRNFDSAFNLEEKASGLLTIQLEVHGSTTRMQLTVPNWTTVIALKHYLRESKITDKSNEEITIVFNNQKLGNSYWALQDYQVQNFSRLLVKLHKAVLEKVVPFKPITIEVGDDVRKAIIKKRLGRRRIGDIFNFALLHMLYDPSSSQAMYDPAEVAVLEATRLSLSATRTQSPRLTQFANTASHLGKFVKQSSDASLTDAEEKFEKRAL